MKSSLTATQVVTATLTFGLVGVLVLGIVRGETSLADFRSLEGSKHLLEERLRNLEEENASLANEIQKIKASSEYARKLLRDKYHETEEGERIVFFTD